MRDLESRIQDQRSIISVDCLLDAVQSLVADCDHTSIRKIKNIDAFTSRYGITFRHTTYAFNQLINLNYRYNKICGDVSELRMKPADFRLIKVIGRGAFGEVQLVRHKSTKKV